MQNLTISDYFVNKISELEVEAAIFTTYNLDLLFFECEIIPLLFNSNESFSNDSRIKTIQVREKLRESRILVDLFFDETVFNSTQRMPMMEYGFFGIRYGSGAFHAKTSLVLGKNAAGEKELLVFAGSNNLTKSGWWDNVETINSLKISKKEPPGPSTLKALKSLLDYLLQEAKIKEDNSALASIDAFIRELQAGNEEEAIFYFSYQTDFPSFLKKHLGKDYTTVEIISPYFPDSSESDLFRQINASGKIFLPQKQEGEKTIAQCTEIFFSYMKKQGFSWAQFKNEIEKKLDLDKKRYIHAKLYVFNTPTSKGKWAFAGSVNFTQKAFFSNIEAGFLFETQVNTLLEPLGEETSFGFLTKSLDAKAGIEADEDADPKICNIRLLFDWKPDHKTLSIYGKIPQNSQPKLEDHEGKLLLELSPNKTCYKIKEDSHLVKHLKKNGYVRFVCCGKQCEIYVQQKNWDFKPLPDYPELTMKEIIHIYTSMSPAKRRYDYISASIVRKLVQQGEANEYTNLESTEGEGIDFFSEYAELFYAFRKIRKACENDRAHREYYLLSQRPDSLSSLIEVVEKDDAIDNVIKFLVLLSAKELYDFYKVPFKYGGLLEKIRKSFDDQTFIGWFESEFSKQYRIVRDS